MKVADVRATCLPTAPARDSWYMTPASGKKPIFVSGIAITVSA